MARDLHPIVLCGGAGRRLWPFVHGARPKALLPVHGAPLLRHTLDRLDNLDARPPVLAVGAAHLDVLRAWVGAGARWVVEPVPRDTAPAVAAALNAVDDPDALVLVTPADLWIAPPTALADAVHAGRPAAEAGAIVLFGAPATRAATGFGWIIPDGPGPGPRPVRTFVEKPDAIRAHALRRSGARFNAGMVLARAATLRDALAALAPAIVACADAAWRRIDDHGIVRLAPSFGDAPAIAFDRAVLEHTAQAVVVDLGGRWDDIGAWDRVPAAAPDLHGNRLPPEASAIASRACTVHGSGRPVVLVGVEDLTVVDSPDGVLVLGAGHAESVRGAEPPPAPLSWVDLPPGPAALPREADTAWIVLRGAVSIDGVAAPPGTRLPSGDEDRVDVGPAGARLARLHLG